MGKHVLFVNTFLFAMSPYIYFMNAETVTFTIAKAIQSWAKRCTLSCVNSRPRPVARGIQEAGFTQPMAHLIAHLCNCFLASSRSVVRLKAALQQMSIGAIWGGSRAPAMPASRWFFRSLALSLSFSLLYSDFLQRRLRRRPEVREEGRKDTAG